MNISSDNLLGAYAELQMYWTIHNWRPIFLLWTYLEAIYEEKSILFWTNEILSFIRHAVSLFLFLSFLMNKQSKMLRAKGS